MYHVASESFYTEIGDELNAVDCVLVEGVQFHKNRRTRIWDLAARAIGLAAQSKTLRYPENIEKKNVDMRRERFMRLFGALPFLERLQFWLLRYTAGLLCVILAIRPRGKRFLFNRSNRDAKERPNSLNKLIRTKRDFYIARNVETALEESLRPGAPKRIYAIVFGAGHMPAIAQRLRKLGFRVKERKWMDIVVPVDWMT